MVVAALRRQLAVTFQTPRRLIAGHEEWEIPKGVWAATGIGSWDRGDARHYPALWKETCCKFPRHKIVPITDIEVFFRSPIEKRFTSILVGMRSGAKIPPIWVRQSSEGVGKPYELENGFHRFYSSLAVGFSEIPVEILPTVAR